MKQRVLLVSVLAAVLGAGTYFWLSHFSSKSDLLPQGPQRPAAGEAAAPGPRTNKLAGPASQGAASGAAGGSREFDRSVNPYAAALREPGKSKRAWPVDFLASLQHPASGAPIRFELTGGRMAVGTIGLTQYRDEALVYVSGELTEPERGKFFFLEPPAGGKAGKAVGVIEFPASRTAYRLEPTGPNGDPELWQRRLDEVLCLSMPPADPARVPTTPTAEMPPLRPDLGVGVVPSYNSNIVSLQSYPGSKAVLLLDFFGGYTPTWGGVVYSRPANISNGTIRDLWKRVAEDFMPFNINVTTDLRVYQAAPAASRQRCCFTDTPVTAAGVAYVGSWNWGNDTPCWSVYTTGKNGAEVGAHEPGHTLGLGHQGSTTDEYYDGQGSGVTGWAPIMGVGYYQPVATWAKGEYQNANNTQDELNVIVSQNNNVAYRSDDTGTTLATARYLELYPDGAAAAEGVIERTGDTDAFRFTTTTGGRVSFTALPVGDWSNLAMMISLADANDTVLSSSNPQTSLSATVTMTVAAGTYTVRVTGAGRNNALTTGFSSYGSLGYYSVVGSVPGGVLPTRLSVVEHVPAGTVVGTVPARSPGSALAYALVGGNTGNTFTLDETGTLVVANNTLLDYNRLATNTMLAVQFELFVHITNLDNPDLTELNRRVVVAVRQAGGSYPVAATGYNAGVIMPYNATTALPKAKAFDVPNNWCFYQAGLSGNPQIGGSGGLQGLPVSGSLLSPIDGTTFQLGPYGETNALVLGNAYPSSGTLTLLNPQPYNSLVILATSANGGGVGTLVVNFTNGTHSAVFNFNAQDWFGASTNVAAPGVGRVKLGQGVLSTDSINWENPSLYQTTINLAALGLNQAVASITFSNPNVGGSQNAGIFALSGIPMPPAVSISVQPQSITNVQPALGATFNVAAMGTPPLSYQWYYSASGSAGSFAPLAQQTDSSLVLPPVLQATNAGWFYAVVTNSFSAATSTVAKLAVLREPAITQQPSPVNLVLLTGMSNTFSVSAEGALPLTYAWLANGVPLAGAGGRTLILNKLRITDTANYSVMVSNAYGATTSSVVALTVLAVTNVPYVDAVLADRPMAYWRLDERTGTVAHDYVGGWNGTFLNTLLGQPGNALLDTHTAARFGVLSANNSYVGGIPVDFAASANGAFTVEAWVNGGAQTTDSGILTKGAGGGGEQFNLDCGASGHAFRFFVRDGGGNAHLANSTVVPNNKWHHLVGVCDQAKSNIVLYVDGTNVASATITPKTGIKGSTNRVTFGARQSGSGTYDLQFVGSIEEVAFYRYALSSNQVRLHFNAVTNRPPVFRPNPFTVAAAAAGQYYSASITASASDPNNDALTFAKVSGPAWLSVSSAGFLSGIPANLDAGTNTFQLSVRDPSGASSTGTLWLYVNGSPVFGTDPFAAPPAAVGQSYAASIGAMAADPNNDPLAFAKLSGPAWLTIDASGALTGIPAESDAGPNQFQVSAADPGGLSASATMTIEVARAASILASACLQGGDLLLSWSGGTPPYQVQMTTNLAEPDWQDVGVALDATSLVVSPTNAATWYRVRGQ